MPELNYEAIGRCKILAEKVKELHIKRMEAIGALRSSIYSLHQKGDINKAPPEIVVFDASHLSCLVETVASADGELMRIVSEYNNWCQDAGEKPIKLIELG
ncbi:hypothetical protein [Hafnia paralvei]|jgi:hypothetical protein|uniref:hypothetical protein n=1 Tax=Hafnia paralvei TaxID=546367 RepID=UPI003A0FE56B